MRTKKRNNGIIYVFAQHTTRLKRGIYTKEKETLLNLNATSTQIELNYFYFLRQIQALK